MDKLKECAIAFEKLFGIKYRCIIGRKGKTRELVLTFTAYEFHHLCGLNKLSDMPLLRKNRERVFKDIISEKITYRMVSLSPSFCQVQDRIEYLRRLEEFLDSNSLIFSYDKRNRKSSSIEAKYLLQNNIDDKVAYYFVGDNEYDGSLIGVSFFLKGTIDYTVAQPRWTLLYKEKIYGGTGIVEVQHDRLNAQEKKSLLS